MHLVRNEAEHERLEHPLNCIMQTEESPDRVKISTTDVHLPQRIGEALEHAYHGELELAMARMNTPYWWVGTACAKTKSDGLPEHCLALLSDFSRFFLALHDLAGPRHSNLLFFW